MGISRRSFIKAGLAGTAVLGSSSAVISRRWFRPVSASGKSTEEIRYTYHTTNCGGRCAFKCTVRDGKLSIIEPNTWPDKRFSTVCLKGLSEVERIYGPSRVKTPLKRVGARGEGEFVQISWEEALSTIHENLKGILDKHGGEAVLFSKSSGVEHTYEFLTKGLGLTRVAWPAIDTGIANGLKECIGGGYYGPTQNEITDWVYSSTIIMLGHNILETTMTDSKFFFDAKEAGAKIIVVDPSYSTTAQKADQWVQIKPGSDNALVLAMISIVIDNKWYNEEYMVERSSAPFLVREDNSKLLLLDNSREFHRETNPYLVWDANSNSAKPYNASGIRPALEGNFTVDGIRVKTVFTGLKENQKQYTAEWASEITEIPADVIYQITKDFATRGPAVLDWGYGPIDKMGNADVVGHAGAVLGTLTGNIGGRIGGSIGSTSHHFAVWGANLSIYEAGLTPYPVPEQYQETVLSQVEMPVSELRFRPNPVRAVINVGNTFQQHYADMIKTGEWLDSLDFVVTIDPFHSSSANYADIVLPASTAFESEYDLMNAQVDRNHVVMSQRVIEPLFESKSDFQIEKEILAKFGLEHIHPPTPGDWLEKRFVSPDPALKGINVSTLQENNFIMRLNVPDEPYRRFMDGKYDTPTEKIEIFHENFVEDNQAYPNYDPPLEIHNEELLKKYPLYFNQAHSKYRVHSQFYNVEWIDQFNKGPRVEINPIDAKERGIVDGDIVEVFNDRGSFKVKAALSEAMRPKQIRVSEGWWTVNMIEGNWQNVTNSAKNPRQYKLVHGPVIAYADTLVEVRKA